MKTLAQRRGIALPLAAAFLFGTVARAFADPPIFRSWYVRNSGLYARVVPETGVAETTIWDGQPKPAYTDIQEVRYDSSYVYVRTAGLPSHGMGPWYNDHNNDGRLELLPGKPINQHVMYRFPRKPKIPFVKAPTGVEAVGLWVNGISVFNVWSGLYYSAGADVGGADPSTKIWTCNAGVCESQTFDAPGGHQPEDTGEYHYHQNPVGLRYQLGDSMAKDPDYSERPDGDHSPILGWANDGLPIYGPYGYSDPTNKLSGVRHMRTGYTLRNGALGTTNLSLTGRHSLPKWAADLYGFATTDLVDSGDWGPAVSDEFPIGHYTEDYDYLGDLGFIVGRDFDLNKYNARWCVTPDFPNGTWAYFVTIDDSGAPVYPYVIGREYMGNPSYATRMNSLTWIDPGTTLYAIGGSESVAKILSVSVGSLGKTITWSSIEGATYSILGAKGGGKWTVITSDLKSSGLETSLTISKVDPAYAFTKFLVAKTKLDDFDSVFP